MSVERLLIYFLVFFSLFNIFFILITLFEKPVKKKKYSIKKKLPIVSIIVPAYNEEKNIQKTLKNLLKINYPKNKLDIIVVDDGSTDRTYEIAARFKCEYLRVYRKKNGGKGSALNFGLKKAKGNVIATLDADSFPEKDALLKMLPYFEDKRVMAVTPGMLAENSKNFIERIQHAEYLFGVLIRKIMANINAVHVTPGPLSIYRREFFEKHGLFDEKNLTEDTEIALRIQKNNYKIETAMDAKVTTIVPKNFKDLLKQRRRWYRGFLENTIKYKELFNFLNYGFLSLILVFAYLSIIVNFAYISYLGFKNFEIVRDSIRSFGLIGFEILSPSLIKADAVYEGIYNYFSNPLVIFGIFGMTIIISLLIFTKKTIRMKKGVFLNVIVFMFFYVFIYTFFWIYTIINKITGKKEKW